MSTKPKQYYSSSHEHVALKLVLPLRERKLKFLVKHKVRPGDGEFLKLFSLLYHFH